MPGSFSSPHAKPHITTAHPYRLINYYRQITTTIFIRFYYDYCWNHGFIDAIAGVIWRHKQQWTMLSVMSTGFPIPVLRVLLRCRRYMHNLVWCSIKMYEICKYASKMLEVSGLIAKSNKKSRQPCDQKYKAYFFFILGLHNPLPAKNSKIFATLDESRVDIMLRQTLGESRDLCVIWGFAFSIPFMTFSLNDLGVQRLYLLMPACRVSGFANAYSKV